MNEQMLRVDGIELCTESFGNPNAPAVLLIMGATASMIWWEDEFCQRLADQGRYVIRYDNRDVGRSTTYEPGQPGYTLEDMADDAIRVLEGYGISQAHFVGMSLGGLLTMLAAVRHPQKVLTATLVMTSAFAPGLPPMEEKVEAFFAAAANVDLTNEQAAVDQTVEKWKILKGSKHPCDEERIRRLAIQEVRRASRLSSMFNHGLLTGGESDIARVHEIEAPALVIHGTEDPILPYEHGVALANQIPGAVLLTLEGTGHELHRDDWERMIDAIINHTARAQ
ncbi:alpha/beta fold hydrolase [Paenibacillus tyrfis]|uniref:alpha/beta fold hydrolase n=1 Tax=Paenibacillus tyrfis TaxID=1501230 RepID=UPI00209E9B45|nr:alpha/beta hydrolase [Paenibacillus tyrfis]MCP1308977.1 alpha/beta fold hydrolase [Paenibacillus tyrfis]